MCYYVTKYSSKAKLTAKNVLRIFANNAAFFHVEKVDHRPVFRLSDEQIAEFKGWLINQGWEVTYPKRTGKAVFYVLRCSKNRGFYPKGNGTYLFDYGLEVLLKQYQRETDAEIWQIFDGE